MVLFIIGFFAGALVSLFMFALCNAADRGSSPLQDSPTMHNEDDEIIF